MRKLTKTEMLEKELAEVWVRLKFWKQVAISLMLAYVAALVASTIMGFLI